jgi:predicted PurR-regulated permease PerM
VIHLKNDQGLQRKTFLFILILVTIALIAVLLPFYGAVFWAGILALLFTPLQRLLLHRLPGRPNLAALCTLLFILFLVILPVTLISASLVRQATLVYGRIRSREIDFGRYLEQVLGLLPDWLRGQLEQSGLLDPSGLQDRLGESASQVGQYLAPQAINIGQNTLSFLVSFGVMMYLLYFLLRDGRGLARQIRDAIPLAESQKDHLLKKFATVIKATVKGNVAVAATQGALGGLILWALGIQGAVLWAVVMAFLSLLPAVGAALIWGPIALYFFATGAVWQGVILTAWGILVIGLVDNVLRPILVGKDTKMPDYVVLITTLGGLSLFGINGFVIGPLIAAMFIAAWDLFAAPEKVAAEEAQDAAAEAQAVIEAEEKAHERALEAQAKADAKADARAAKAAQIEAEGRAQPSTGAVPGTASFAAAPVPPNPGRTSPAGRS